MCSHQVVIVDVLDKDHCVCRTDDGKILEGYWFETDIATLSTKYILMLLILNYVRIFTRYFNT